MANENTRVDPPRAEQCRHRLSDREDSRLRIVGVSQRLLGLNGVAGGGEQKRAKVAAQVRNQRRGAAVQCGAKRLLTRVELKPHVDVLGALAGKCERNGWIDALRAARE